MEELALGGGTDSSLIGEGKAEDIESHAERWIDMVVEVCGESLLRVPPFSVK